MREYQGRRRSKQLPQAEGLNKGLITSNEGLNIVAIGKLGRHTLYIEKP